MDSKRTTEVKCKNRKLLLHPRFFIYFFYYKKQVILLIKMNDIQNKG